MALAATAQRVPAHTDREINERITRQAKRNIVYYAAHPEEIEARLKELDEEWDIERSLETNAATATLVSIVLGLLVRRVFLYMPLLIGGFLLQHALQGWCPPLPLLRRLGVRTQSEIERERYILKAVRGDFNHLQSLSSNTGLDVNDEKLKQTEPA